MNIENFFVNVKLPSLAVWALYVVRGVHGRRRRQVAGLPPGRNVARGLLRHPQGLDELLALPAPVRLLPGFLQRRILLIISKKNRISKRNVVSKEEEGPTTKTPVQGSTDWIRLSIIVWQAIRLIVN